MRVVAAARARCRSGRRAAHRAPAVGGGCPLTAGASEGGGATGAPPSGCYASACPRGERVARQRASPFGALHTVRRRFPLILSLERGGRGLTRKPPQPRGYLHGTGGKNSRRGVAARLLFVGGNPPLRARHRSAQLAAARRRRRPRRRRRLPRRLAEWWWCVGVARARARLPYIPFDPIFLSFPLSQHHLSLTQGLLSNNIANVTSYNMMFGTQTFFTRVSPREMRRSRRP